MGKFIKGFVKVTLLFALFFSSCNGKLKNEGFYSGWAIEDITPEGKVSLQGQFYERISEYVQSPLKATALAIEYSDGKSTPEQAIMVSLDLVGLQRKLQDTLRLLVKEKIPDFETRKLFLNATHTHSSFRGNIPGEYTDMLLDKLTKVVVSAWKNRQPSGISNGFGYAVTGHNRRVKYTDGTAEMYGSTARNDFLGIEGPSDPCVDMLFTWDLKRKLTGVIMNVSCPAQVTESKYYVSADYWSEVRKHLKERFSHDVYVLPQIGAAGDQSPRNLPNGYKAGEPNMWDIPGIIEIGNRLIKTFDEVYPAALNSIRTKPVFKHIVEDISLPVRIYSVQEYEEARKLVDEIRSREPLDPNSPDSAWNRFLKETHDNEKIREFGPWDDKKSDYGVLRAYEGVIERYNDQEKEPVYSPEIHVLRIGDVALASNPFELFVDYGFRITGRSEAGQVFIIQLSGDGGGYLPTREAVQGGGYSAIVNRIGPQGGDILVERTVNIINSMWADK